MNKTDFKFKRIMIVDDTKIDRYVSSYVLKKNQLAEEIIEFDMATKAIAYLEQNQDKPELLPEVILLDIRMPEMDGFQFLERISLLSQSLKQSCSIVILSSSLDPYDHKRIESSPVVLKFINKPLKKESFEEIISLYQSSGERVK